MVDDNNPLTPEQMAARIAELEGGAARLLPCLGFSLFYFF